jgi:hypothetical protein
VPLLVLKLTLTPLVIGASAFVARRWGPAVSGWVVALPLTSGPVALYLALEHGPRFAADAGIGSLVGGVGQCAFAVAYAGFAARGRGPAMASAALAFVAATGLLDGLGVRSLPVVLPLLAVAVTIALWRLPAGRVVPLAAPTPVWDLPLRIAIGTGLVLAITAAAPIVGPTVSGILVAYPVVFSILIAFTHGQRGQRAALTAARGLVTGIVGFGAFFAILVVTLGESSVQSAVGIGGAFAVALAAVLVVQAFSFRVLHAAPVVTA